MTLRRTTRVYRFVGVSDSKQFCPFATYVMIALEQYRHAIGLYASKTGGLNKRHVHASFRFRLRLRLFQDIKNSVFAVSMTTKLWCTACCNITKCINLLQL